MSFSFIPRQSEIYNITWFPFSMNQFLCLLHFSGAFFIFCHKGVEPIKALATKWWFTVGMKWGKIWEMPSGNVFSVIALADKQLFLLYYHPQHNRTDCELFLRPYLSHSSLLPWLQQILAVLIHVRWWCVCAFFFWQKSPRGSARFQENMPRVADNNPLYWQAFHTDQHLMGFIINRDDSFFPPLSLWWGR